MILEQRAELVWRHTNARDDVSHGAPRHVLARVDRHRNRAPVGMPHEVVAALDARYCESGALQGLDDLCSWYNRDAAGHKPARYYKSGYVECQSHLVRYADLFDQEFQPLTEVVKRGFSRWSIAERGNAWAQGSGAAPHAVLILLDDVGHVHDTSHFYSMPRSVETLSC